MCITYYSYLTFRAYTGMLQTVFYSAPPCKSLGSSWCVYQDLPSVGGVARLIFTVITSGCCAAECSTSPPVLPACRASLVSHLTF